MNPVDDLSKIILSEHPQGNVILLRVQEALSVRQACLPAGADPFDPYYQMIVRLHYLEAYADLFGVERPA